jgi:hypothetical protein
VQGVNRVKDSPRPGIAAQSIEGRVRQDRTGQDKTGQDRAGQDRTGQCGAESALPYDMSRQCEASLGGRPALT